MRKGLSAQGMYTTIKERSLKIPDSRLQRPQTIPLTDNIMSAMAMFSMKYPSMHQFRKDFQEDTRSSNLKNLFGVQNAPSDTTMRKVLDNVETSHFQDFLNLFFH